MRLTKPYGSERVEMACRRALAIQGYACKSVKSILKNGLDRQPLLFEQPVDSAPSTHHNTRDGIYRICKKYLSMTLEPKRLLHINPVHSFRHSRAVDLLQRGRDITEIKNRLGHDNIQSTMAYLHLDLNRRRRIQKDFIRYMQSVIHDDKKIDRLLQWKGDKDILKWLDSL